MSKMEIRVVEDSSKIYIIGYPPKIASTIITNIPWEEVHIKVVDAPDDPDHPVKRPSYIFSSYPMEGSIPSSICYKESHVGQQEEELEEEYLESEEELEDEDSNFKKEIIEILNSKPEPQEDTLI